MFADLSINIGASIIYDAAKWGLGKLNKKETVQTVLKQLGASPALHDFPDRYVESLVELRYADKSPVVLNFFREESIMQTFFVYYYGNTSERHDTSLFQTNLAHHIEALKVGDEVKAANIDVDAEIRAFWVIFEQKVHESKTLKEVELEQLLLSIQKKNHDLEDIFQLFLQQLKQQGKTSIQVADKIYNIEHINQATFKDLLRKIPHYLTTPPFMPSYFLGREEEMQAVHDKLFGGENFLMLVNGQGGIGKTSFAAKYWDKYQAEYTHLAFLFVANGIADALLTLAAALDLHFPAEMSGGEKLQWVIYRLSNLEKPCLLILDNANDEQELNAHILLLRQCPNCHILLTSRLESYKAAEKHSIGALPKPLALQLFRKHYELLTDAEIPLFEEVYEVVGGNTLVLELLAKNLTNFNNKLKKRYTLAQLLADLQSNLLRLSQSDKVETAYQAKGTGWRQESPEAIISGMYELSELEEEERKLLSIFAVLPAEHLAFDTLESLLAGSSQPNEQVAQLQALAQMLGVERLLAALKENNIEMEEAQLTALLNTSTATFEKLDQTLLSLVQKGWVEENEKGYKVSPVVQAVTHYKQPDLLADCRALMNYLIEGMSPEALAYGRYEQAEHCAYFAQAMLFALQGQEEYDIAHLCQNLGNYYAMIGNLSSALQVYSQMQVIQQALVQQSYTNDHYKNGLAISYEKLGETHTSLGNLENALRFFEIETKLFEELYEANPTNVSFKNGLAISYEKLGSTHTSLGNLENALRFFEQRNRLGKELYEANPTNVEFKNGLAISYSKLGETHTSLGNLENALRFFEIETKLFEELYEANPTNVSFKNGLAISYSKLGSTHTSLGNLENALRFFEQRNRLGKELYEANPTNVEFKNGLAISYEKLGSTHTSLGNLENALRFFEIETKLFEELYEANPMNVSFKNGLAISYEKLGETHTSLGNLENALRFFEQDLALTKELYEANPTNVEFKNGLAISYAKLGEFSRDKLQDKAKAKSYFQQAEVLWRELVRDAPQYVQFQRFLGMVQGILKDL